MRCPSVDVLPPSRGPLFGLELLQTLDHSGRREVSLAAGCLFAVHPVHAEAVASVVGLADLLSAMAVLTGLLLYIEGMDTLCGCGRKNGDSSSCSSVRGFAYFAAAVACCIVGLLCKETAIVAPVLFVAYDCFVLDATAARQLVSFIVPYRWQARATPSPVRGLLCRGFAMAIVTLTLTLLRLGERSSSACLL